MLALSTVKFVEIFIQSKAPFEAEMVPFVDFSSSIFVEHFIQLLIGGIINVYSTEVSMYIVFNITNNWC